MASRRGVAGAEADLEEDSIRAPYRGFVVIAVGGGGIPVVADPEGNLTGIAAVIDKDHASSLLASRLRAELFVISTSVERVALRFGTRSRRGDRPTPEPSATGQGTYFAEGSMAPRSGGHCSSSLSVPPSSRTDNVERALAETGTHRARREGLR
jgi:carbamate kinase